MKEFDPGFNPEDLFHLCALNQKLVLTSLERGADLKVPPSVALVALYHVIAIQIEANLKQGNLEQEQIDKVRALCKLVGGMYGEQKTFLIDKTGRKK